MTTAQLSPHFMLDEFIVSETAHELGLSNTPERQHLVNLQALAATMEQVRALFGRSIHITSGYRSPAVNRAVRGVPNSDHALGYAADFHVAGMSDLEVAKAIVASPLKFDQIIWERGRCVHLSVNPRMRRQALSQHGPAGSPFVEGIG